MTKRRRPDNHVPIPSRDRVAYARQRLEEAQAVLAGYPYVTGVGVGLQRSAGRSTGEVAFVVTVSRKDDPRRPLLGNEQHLPKELFGVPVDVQRLPRITLKAQTAGGADVCKNNVPNGHVGLLARSPGGTACALTAMHVFQNSLVEKPLNQGPYFDVKTRMPVGNPEKVGRLLAGSFSTTSDVAYVGLDAGVDTSNVLLGTNDVVLGVPPQPLTVDPGTVVNISIPGEVLLEGHLSSYPIPQPSDTSNGTVHFQNLMHFRVAQRGIEEGWSGSLVFDALTSEPLALLSFGTDAIDTDGFSHAFGFPLAKPYQDWGLSPL